MNLRISQYFDHAKVDRLGYYRQLLFLLPLPLTILPFVLHLFGVFGQPQPSLLACSVGYVVVSLVALAVYLQKGPKRLASIFSVYLVAVMMIQFVRLLLLANLEPQRTMLAMANITMCFTIVLFASMALLPWVTLLCSCLNISLIAICGYLTHNPLYWQFLVFFGSMEVAITVFCFIFHRLMQEQTEELHSYADTVGQVLNVFNVSKTELLTLLHVTQTGDLNPYDGNEMLDRLNPKTVRNIIRVADHLKAATSHRRAVTAERFPMLTPTELDVCRMVEQGKTLRQIADAMGKTTSNISTVRGNIRKKLGLSPEEDLREYLVKRR